MIPEGAYFPFRDPRTAEFKKSRPYLLRKPRYQSVEAQEESCAERRSGPGWGGRRLVRAGKGGSADPTTCDRSPRRKMLLNIDMLSAATRRGGGGGGASGGVARARMLEARGVA